MWRATAGWLRLVGCAAGAVLLAVDRCCGEDALRRALPVLIQRCIPGEFRYNKPFGSRDETSHAFGTIWDADSNTVRHHDDATQRPRNARD